MHCGPAVQNNHRSQCEIASEVHFCIVARSFVLRNYCLEVSIQSLLFVIFCNIIYTADTIIDSFHVVLLEARPDLQQNQKIAQESVVGDTRKKLFRVHVRWGESMSA